MTSRYCFICAKCEFRQKNQYGVQQIMQIRLRVCFFFFLFLFLERAIKYAKIIVDLILVMLISSLFFRYRRINSIFVINYANKSQN